MQMLAVVPGDECQHPLPRQVDVLESMRRVAWRVLACAEPGFDMGVVVRDAGAAVRRRDAQRLQFGLERVRLCAAPLSACSTSGLLWRRRSRQQARSINAAASSPPSRACTSQATSLRLNRSMTAYR